MKTKSIAALSLLLCAFVAMPASAGKPDRNPSEKDCTNMEFYPATACSDELDAAYDYVGGLLSNNGDVPTFLSRNPDKDAGTLQCKLSGAEIKYATDKTGEAQWLVQDALDKILVLLNQGKLSEDGYALIKASFDAAQGCVGTP